MKLVFEGENIIDIQAQVLQAAEDIKGHPAPVRLVPTETRGEELPSIPTVGSDTNIGQSTNSGLGKSRIEESFERIQKKQAAEADKDLTLDADGVPWDERIHSKGQEQSNDGRWRKRRNLDKGVHEQITAELQAQYGGKQALPTGPMIEVPPVPTSATRVNQPAPPASLDQALTMQGAQVIPTPIVAQTPPPIPQAPVNPLSKLYTVQDFGANVTAIVAQLVTDNKLNQAWIQNCAKECFAGKEVYEWNNNKQGILDLYNSFITWKFIQKLEV